MAKKKNQSKKSSSSTKGKNDSIKKAKVSKSGTKAKSKPQSKPKSKPTVKKTRGASKYKGSIKRYNIIRKALSEKNKAFKDATDGQSLFIQGKRGKGEPPVKGSYDYAVQEIYQASNKGRKVAEKKLREYVSQEYQKYAPNLPEPDLEIEFEEEELVSGEVSQYISWHVLADSIATTVPANTDELIIDLSRIPNAMYVGLPMKARYTKQDFLRETITDYTAGLRTLANGLEGESNGIVFRVNFSTKNNVWFYTGEAVGYQMYQQVDQGEALRGRPEATEVEGVPKLTPVSEKPAPVTQQATPEEYRLFREGIREDVKLGILTPEQAKKDIESYKKQFGID